MLQMVMERAVLLQVTLTQHTCNTDRGLTRGSHMYKFIHEVNGSSHLHLAVTVIYVVPLYMYH